MGKILCGSAATAAAPKGEEIGVAQCQWGTWQLENCVVNVYGGGASMSSCVDSDKTAAAVEEKANGKGMKEEESKRGKRRKKGDG